MENALIVFLKFPQPGNVKTRLAADLGARPAALIYEAMAERVITEVYPLEASYDVFLYVDPLHPQSAYSEWLGEAFSYRPQRGADLGERMANAFGEMFERGYEKVAIIGTDCTGMDNAFIDEMFERLEKQDFILGPSNDGGYYLLAMKETNPWIFEDVDWSTNSVLETTLDKIDMRELKVYELEEKMDVDTPEDLVEYQQSLPEEHFLAKKIGQIVLDAVSIPDGKMDQFTDEP